MTDKKPPKKKTGKAKAKPSSATPQRSERSLTEMQKRFCEFLAQGQGQSEAMVSAGSKAGSPGVTASRWLKLAKVQDYLQSLPEVQAQAEERQVRIATAQERQEWWTKVMLGQIQVEAYDMFGNMYMKRPSLRERLQASETLGKAQGDFKDDDGNKVQPQVIINLPTRAMTQDEIEEARRANGNA